MRVWLNDLGSNWMAWLSVLLTSMVSVMFCAIAVEMISAGGDAAGPLGGTALGMALCAIVWMSLGQMRLILEEHDLIYQSWRMAGMPLWKLSAMVLGQVILVSALGGSLGLWPAHVSMGFAWTALSDDGIPIGPLSMSRGVAAIAILVCVGAGVTGAICALFRMNRGSGNRSTLWGVVKVVIALAVIGSATVPAMSGLSRPDDAVSWSMGLVVLLAVMCGWLLPLLDQWTRVLGVAGANIRARRQFVTPQIVPWVLVGGLLVAVGSGFRVLLFADPGSGISSWQVIAVVLGPTVVPSLAAALSTTLIMRRRIHSDSVVLWLAGAPRRAVLSVQLKEAMAMTLTAGVVVATMAMLTVAVLNKVLTGQASIQGFWLEAFLLLLGAMFVLNSGIKVAVAWVCARDTAQFHTRQAFLA